MSDYVDELIKAISRNSKGVVITVNSTGGSIPKPINESSYVSWDFPKLRDYCFFWQSGTDKINQISESLKPDYIHAAVLRCVSYKKIQLMKQMQDRKVGTYSRAINRRLKQRL